MRWASLTDVPVRLAPARAFSPLLPDITVQSFGAQAEAIAPLTRDLAAKHTTV